MSEQIQPEGRTRAADSRIQSRRSFPPARPRPQGTLGDRVFARRDFDFWHPGTIEAFSSIGVTVLFDDMDEAALDPADTMVLELRRDDLVFIRGARGMLGGHPARVVRVLHEAVEVSYETSLDDADDTNTHFLSDVRVYAESVATPWRRGDRVAAYLPIAFDPPLPLWFPGIVHEVRESLVEIDFFDGGQSLVPATLVQSLELTPGMALHSRTEYWTTGTRYYPCRIVEIQGDDVLVEDHAGLTFNSHISLLGIVPRGYRLEGARLVKEDAFLPSAPTALLPAEGPRNLLDRDHDVDRSR